MSEASKLVTDSLLGKDTETIIINGKAYFVSPPTIERIAGAANYLHSLEGGKSMKDVLEMMKNIKDSCKALSIFIQGDDSLCEELSNAMPNEVLEGLKTAFSLISIQNFLELSTLARSVARMIANPRP